MAEPSAPSFLTFTSDYGLEDSYVGVCTGVIARLAPHTRVIDVLHAVAPQDIAQGASVLAASVPHLPVGVHLVLVDPPAAIAPRAVAVRTADGSTFVAPDNGVASLAWPVLGGVVAAHALDDPSLHLPDAHRAFRGRDVLAPVAARLSTGLALADVGSPVDQQTLVRVRVRPATVDADSVRGQVRAVDHFGNLGTTVTRADLEAAGIVLGDIVELRLDARSLQVPFAASYGEVAPGRVAVCEDATRGITIGVNLGRAADVLRARRGDPVVISQAPREPVRAPALVGLLDPPPRTATPAAQR